MLISLSSDLPLDIVSFLEVIEFHRAMIELMVQEFNNRVGLSRLGSYNPLVDNEAAHYHQ